MNVLGFAKGSVSLITGIGAGKIAGYAIKKVLPETLSTAENVVVVMGAFALGGAAGKLASDYVEDLADAVIDLGDTIVTQVKEKRNQKDKDE